MRLPLATDLLTRDGTATKDARMLNTFVDGSMIFKRPGIASPVLVTVSGVGQGGIENNALLFVIFGDTMRSYNASLTLQSTFTL